MLACGIWCEGLQPGEDGSWLWLMTGSAERRKDEEGQAKKGQRGLFSCWNSIKVLPCIVKTLTFNDNDFLIYDLAIWDNEFMLVKKG